MRPAWWHGHSLRTTLTAATLFALVSAGVRLLAGTSLSMDDAKTNLFTQGWRWGYQADNPPLFEWLTILLHGPFGGLWSFLVLRAALLIAAAGLVHLTVRRYADDRAATCAALGMVLLYQVGWNYHQAFTHSALLLTACCAGLWAGLRLAERGGWRDHLLFGAVLGVGVLSKYNFVLLAGPFLIAAMSVPSARASVLRPRLVVAFGLAALLVLPHALWLGGRGPAFAATLDGSLGLGGTRAERLADGATDLVVACVTFFLPWALIAGWLARRGGRGTLLPQERLLLRSSAIAVLCMVAGVLLLGIGSVSERYVIPALLPAYVAATTALIRTRPAGARPYLTACAVFAGLFTTVRVLTYAVPGPPFCEDCREFVPYAALIRATEDAVPPDAILVSREENTAGNLVAAFPRAQVRSLNLLPMMNPTTGGGRPCYYVWSEDMVGGVPLEPVFAFAYDDPRTVMVDAPWYHPLRTTGFRRTVWGITPLEGRLYDRFCTPLGAG